MGHRLLLSTTALAQTSPTPSVPADLNQYLDESKIERVTSAMRSRFADFIGQDMEILLAAKAGVTMNAFRRQLAVSAEDTDPLVRARAWCSGANSPTR
jgi:DNA-directed RNA polymerase beta subunit